MKQPAEQKPLQHQPVQSTSIKTIGYDEATQELHVAFHGTGGYVYQGVPRHMFDEFMLSDSKGKYLHRNIKGRFSHEKS